MKNAFINAPTSSGLVLIRLKLVHLRCKIEGCDRQFLHANMLISHQISDHRGRIRNGSLNTTICQYPANLVKIKCKLCKFLILNEAR